MACLALAVCCGIWLGGGTAIAQFGGGGSAAAVVG